MSEKRSDYLWLVIAVVVGGLAILLIGWPWNPFMSGMGMMGMMGYGWGFMVWIPIVFFVLIALGVYYLVTGSKGTSRSAANRGGRALEILKERYANGEITREQFLTMKRELER